MPIRFFVPLPGPFVWVRRSPGEREMARQAREARRERLANLPDTQKFWRALAWLVAIWAIVLSAAYQASVTWGVLLTFAAVAHLCQCGAKEQERRRALVAEDDPNGG